MRIVLGVGLLEVITDNASIFRFDSPATTFRSLLMIYSTKFFEFHLKIEFTIPYNLTFSTPHPSSKDHQLQCLLTFIIIKDIAMSEANNT